MAGKKKAKDKPPVFRETRSSYLKPKINEYGEVTKPYKYGSRTVYLTDTQAGRIREELRIYTENKKMIDSKNFPSGNKTVLREHNRRRKLSINKRVVKIASGKYSQSTKAYLTNMPDIVGGMIKVLEDNTPINRAIKEQLNEFMEKIENMDISERARFYEENSDLFYDMSDYYNWLNKNSGKTNWEAESKDGYESVADYVASSTAKIKSINKKLDDFVSREQIDLNKEVYDDLDE